MRIVLESCGAVVQALTKENEVVETHAWFRAVVYADKWYEDAPIDGYLGYEWYDYVVDVDDIVDFACDDYELKEILKIVKSDYQVIEEWHDIDPEAEMERKADLCA